MFAGLKNKLAVPSISQGLQVEEETCRTCQRRKLPQINENLLKDSLRMKSEMTTLTSKHQQSAKVPQIEGQRLRNRTLHKDCEQIHTNSRKQDYERWNVPHEYMTDKYLSNQLAVMQAWLIEGDDSIHSPSDETAELHVHQNSPTEQQRDNSVIPPITDDEDMDEVQRVQNTIERIRRRGKDNEVLNEIRNIKEKHAQLEALTQMKKRVQTTESTKKRAANYRDLNAVENLRRDALKRFLLTKMQLKKEVQFNLFKENTTVSVNRNFIGEISSPDRGLRWKSKWNASHTLTPGKLSRSTHPLADAKKRSEVKYSPPKPGDLAPCIFLPKSVDMKTPVERALQLDRFVNEAIPDRSLRRSKTLPSVP